MQRNLAETIYTTFPPGVSSHTQYQYLKLRIESLEAFSDKCTLSFLSKHLKMRAQLRNQLFQNGIEDDPFSLEYVCTGVLACYYCTLYVHA